MKRKTEPEQNECECGCGGMTFARFINGHNHRGRKQDPELIEKRIRPLRGRKTGKPRPESVRQAVSAGVKRAWAEGKHNTEKAIKSRANRKGASAERMREVWQMVDHDKLRTNNSKMLTAQNAAWKESGELDAIRRKCGLARGMPDHLAAKLWHIRSPEGIVFVVSNMAEWARQNQHRFEDERPGAKTPFWVRIAGGFSDILKSNGKSCSYKGWVAVSKTELDRGAPDLLGRDGSQNSDTPTT